MADSLLPHFSLAEEEAAMRASAQAYRKQCVRLADERDEVRAVLASVLVVLEVDSEWPADRLLDAIGGAIAILREARDG